MTFLLSKLKEPCQQRETPAIQNNELQKKKKKQLSVFYIAPSETHTSFLNEA
jgi:hypothetical protein